MNSYTHKQFDESLVDHWEFILETYEPHHQSSPTSIILGGPPGAGKSSSVGMLSEQYLNSDAIAVSVDDFRRSHPNINNIVKEYPIDWVKQTSNWSGNMQRAIIKRAMHERYNIIAETTFSQSHIPLKFMKEFLKSEYQVSIVVILASKQLARDSQLTRYQNQMNNDMSRRVPTDYSEKIFDEIADNIMKVYDAGLHNSFLVYERKNDNLPSKVYSSLFNKPLTREFIVSIIDQKTKKISR